MRAFPLLRKLLIKKTDGTFIAYRKHRHTGMQIKNKKHSDHFARTDVAPPERT